MKIADLIDARPEAIETAEYVTEMLHTDTLVWQVVGRTPSTLKLRRMREGETVHKEHRGGNPYPVAYIECVPDEDAPVKIVRRRKDGTYRTVNGGYALRAIARPIRQVDYRA